MIYKGENVDAGLLKLRGQVFHKWIGSGKLAKTAVQRTRTFRDSAARHEVRSSGRLLNGNGNALRRVNNEERTRHVGVRCSVFGYLGIQDDALVMLK